MNVLIIGDGGREHALAWKIGQSGKVDEVFCAPGNPNFEGVVSVPEEDSDALVRFAEENNVALTVVGPEAPLCNGVVDKFRENSLPIVGPDAAGAKLEGSKSYAKAFMERYGIPTAYYRKCETQNEAEDALAAFSFPCVIKADGLASGKGVRVVTTTEEAKTAIQDCFGGAYGDAGKTVVLEEALEGREASIIALTDGDTIHPLASSRDYKRAGEGDTGGNTGGMGAYSPASDVGEWWEEIVEKILNPFRQGCKEEGLDYRGIIYAGIMLTEEGPKVLEFNVRMGDPETQAILPRLRSDLLEALMAAEKGELHNVALEWENASAACVVMASEGYPGKYEKGFKITGLTEAEEEGCIVFHAGTSKQDGQILTAGGRVLGVTGKGESLQDALDTAYRGVSHINWQGAYYRRDIGRDAL